MSFATNPHYQCFLPLISIFLLPLSCPCLSPFHLVSSFALLLLYCQKNTVQVRLSQTQPVGQGTVWPSWQSASVHFLMTPRPQGDSRGEREGTRKWRGSTCKFVTLDSRVRKVYSVVSIQVWVLLKTKYWSGTGPLWATINQIWRYYQIL